MDEMLGAVNTSKVVDNIDEITRNWLGVIFDKKRIGVGLNKRSRPSWPVRFFLLMNFKILEIFSDE